MHISIKLWTQKRSKEAERVQQKNQAPMSEEQEGEVIEEEILKKLVFSPSLFFSTPPHSAV